MDHMKYNVNTKAGAYNYITREIESTNNGKLLKNPKWHKRTKAAFAAALEDGFIIKANFVNVGDAYRLNPNFKG